MTDKKLIVQGDKGKQFIVDLGDPLQARYEMVRELSLSGESQADICQKYGYTRATGHHYKKAWQEQRWEGLKDAKRGPKAPFKRTKEVEGRVLSLRFREPTLDMYEIARRLKEEGFDVSPRSVARILKEHDLTLKKTRR